MSMGDRMDMMLESVRDMPLESAREWRLDARLECRKGMPLECVREWRLDMLSESVRDAPPHSALW